MHFFYFIRDLLTFFLYFPSDGADHGPTPPQPLKSALVSYDLPFNWYIVQCVVKT